jgi:hypothetical protein
LFPGLDHKSVVRVEADFVSQWIASKGQARAGTLIA